MQPEEGNSVLLRNIGAHRLDCRVPEHRTRKYAGNQQV